MRGSPRPGGSPLLRLTAALLAASGAAGGSRWAVSAAVEAPVASAGEPQRLQAGATVEGDVPSGQSRSFTIRAEAGQFLHVTLTQNGLDLALAVRGPDGLREADFSDGPQGREEVSLVAASPADVGIAIRGRAGPAREGRYTLTVSAAGPAPADGDRIAAEDLLSRGMELQKDGRAESLAQAAASFAKSREIWRGLGERFFDALCLLREGVARRKLGEHHRARELFEEALPLWRGLGEPAFEAKTLDALGTADYFLNDREKALEHWLAALPLRRAAGDREGEASTLNNIAIGHAVLGRLRTSLEWQEQALALQREIGDRRVQASLLHNMGIGSWRTSRIQEALDRLREALSLSRAIGDRQQEASTVGALGMVYVSLGEPEEALRHYGQALELWNVLGHRSGQAATLEQIGRAQAELGQTDAALDHYRKALDLHRALADRAESATLLSIGMAHKEKGDLAEAALALGDALRLARDTKNVAREAGVLSALGQVHAAQGDTTTAVTELETALGLLRRLGDRTEEAFTLYELARVELGQGAVSPARERVEAALQLVDAVRDDVARYDLRASLLARAGPVHELYREALMREHGRVPAAGFDARAFEATERSRAQSLLALLAQSHVDLREGVDAALLERERTLQERLAFRLDEQMRLLTGSKAEDDLAKAEAEVQALRDEYDNLQAQIRRASPRYSMLRRPEVLTLAEVQRRILDPGTLLLEYALGDERSFLFAVTSTSLRTHVLPGRVEVEAAARRAYEVLAERRPEAERTEVLGALARMVLGPAAAEMAGKRLLVVPDGALQYVPFAALSAPGRADVPLVAEHEIVAMPSASLLAALREEAARRRPPARTLAVFADPVFDERDERVRLAPDGRASVEAGGKAPAGGRASEAGLTRGAAAGGFSAESLPRLPYTRREAKAILSLPPAAASRAALDFDASRKTAVGEDLSDYRFVHFATHGFLNDAHPDMSGLVLSLVDRDGSRREGFLSAGDVYNMKLSADLVVLSGCRTAMGRQIKGEGVVGLARAFMYAGTSRVLASLWKVDDAATAALMTRLYDTMLVRGLSPARALRQAQIEVARERRWRDPYYWAAFQLQGDWAGGPISRRSHEP